MSKSDLYHYQPKVKSLRKIDPTHFLFIGNSYLYYGDGVHNHVKRMARSSDAFNAKSNAFMSITISNGGLHEHSLDSYLTPGKLHIKDPFNVIILQESSALGWDESREVLFKKTISEYTERIRKANGEPVLYMTPAYVKPNTMANEGMTDNLNRIYTETANTHKILVIPVGLAFAEAYRENKDIKLHKDFDGTHPSLLGTILASCTVFASLFGNPIGNSYNYFGKIHEKDLDFVQTIAFETVRKYYSK